MAKGKHATKAVMAAAKKSDKQDDRARKRDLKKQNRMAKNYECQEEREFKSFLAGINLIIKYMDGDGNCLFRSLADQLTGKQDSHMFFRSKVMSYIEQEREHFTLFMEVATMYPLSNALSTPVCQHRWFHLTWLFCLHPNTF